ncbi:MAG: hypothetical protein LBD04_06645 [Synergistaceae bacterium]|jgi:hypothetical protein|nr:hypothetical protein [Synergistaceae bacterium]
MAGNKELIKFGAAWLAYKRAGERFRWLGFSEGGVGLAYTTETSDMFVDQTTSPIRTQITSETLEATFPAVESTIENFTLAFPGAVRVGNSLQIYSASTASPASSTGTALIHPVDRGNPAGDFFDPTDPTYDDADDILFDATLIGSLDITYEREGMLHIPLTFRGTPDPMGRLGVIGSPWAKPFAFADYDLSTTVGSAASQALTATGGTSPYTYAAAQGRGFKLLPDGVTLSFESATPGTYATLVYARDSSPPETEGAQGGKVALAYVEVTVS